MELFFSLWWLKTTKTTKIGKKHLNRQIKQKNNFKREVKNKHSPCNLPFTLVPKASSKPLLSPDFAVTLQAILLFQFSFL